MPSEQPLCSQRESVQTQVAGGTAVGEHIPTSSQSLERQLTASQMGNVAGPGKVVIRPHLFDGPTSRPGARDRVDPGREPDSSDRHVRAFGVDRDFTGPWEAGLRPASSPRKAVERMGPMRTPHHEPVNIRRFESPSPTYMTEDGRARHRQDRGRRRLDTLSAGDRGQCRLRVGVARGWPAPPRPAPRS